MKETLTWCKCEGKSPAGDEEAITQKSNSLPKVPQEQVLCEAETRLQVSPLLVWALCPCCFSSMRAGKLVDFWTDVL